MSSCLRRDEQIFDICFFLDLYQLNRDTYNRVRHWFDQLDDYIQTRICQQIEGFPVCDDLTEGSGNSPINFRIKER